MVKISYMMLKNPLVVPSDTKLLEATIRMRETGTNNILVSRKDKLAGMISIEDVMKYVTERTDWNIPVEKVMHSPELTIGSDRWITDAIEMCEKNNASHVAVVENGEWIGIIRADDILHTYRFEKTGEEK
jgi:signal-transduction protein with cAMP-binding, CBS, and nucleotidyltransferase domain